jgi:hypothetical protein
MKVTNIFLISCHFAPSTFPYHHFFFPSSPSTSFLSIPRQKLKAWFLQFHILLHCHVPISNWRVSGKVWPWHVCSCVRLRTYFMGWLVGTRSGSLAGRLRQRPGGISCSRKIQVVLCADSRFGSFYRSQCLALPRATPRSSRSSRNIPW